jgi:hypothetical protein
MLSYVDLVFTAFILLIIKQGTSKPTTRIEICRRRFHSEREDSESIDATLKDKNLSHVISFA